MKQITFQDSLGFIYQALYRCFISNDMGDAVHNLTNCNYSFDDESGIYFFTFAIHQDDNIETLLDTLADNLLVTIPSNLVKEITDQENDHLLITNSHNDSLSINWNDSTFTCILHITGQY